MSTVDAPIFSQPLSPRARGCEPALINCRPRNGLACYPSSIHQPKPDASHAAPAVSPNSIHQPKPDASREAALDVSLG